MNSGTSDFLNTSRWIAAFFVVLGHVYHISIADYRHVAQPNLLLRGVNFFGEFGYTAVIVFFVISGFLVGGQAIVNFKRKGFNVTDYFVHRFSRIYTVLIPALIVGLTLDWLGIVFSIRRESTTIPSIFILTHLATTSPNISALSHSSETCCNCRQ
jgi:peptidoglycan/LPS O-acetylase OafA/YrhL